MVENSEGFIEERYLGLLLFVTTQKKPIKNYSKFNQDFTLSFPEVSRSAFFQTPIIQLPDELFNPPPPLPPPKPAEEYRTSGYDHALAMFPLTTALSGIEWFLCDCLLIIETVKIRLDETCVG